MLKNTNTTVKVLIGNGYLESLKCVKCDKTTLDSFFLPCHTICKPCLNSYPLKKNSPLSKCPICGNDTDILDASYHRSFENCFTTVSKVLKDSLCTEDGSTCCVCRRNGVVKPTSHQCLNCGDTLCETCQNGHRSSSATYAHEVVSFHEVERKKLKVKINRKIRCDVKEHREKICEFFCESCDKLLCPLCFIQGHVEHDIKSLDEAAAIRRQKIWELSQRFEEGLRDPQSLSGTLMRHKHNIDVTQERTLQKLREKTQDLINVILHQEQELVNKVKSLCEKQRHDVDRQQKKYTQIQQSLLKTIELSGDVVKGATGEEMVLVFDAIRKCLENETVSENKAEMHNFVRNLKSPVFTIHDNFPQNLPFTISQDFVEQTWSNLPDIVETNQIPVINDIIRAETNGTSAKENTKSVKTKTEVNKTKKAMNNSVETTDKTETSLASEVIRKNFGVSKVVDFAARAPLQEHVFDITFGFDDDGELEDKKASPALIEKQDKTHSALIKDEKDENSGFIEEEAHSTFIGETEEEAHSTFTGEKDEETHSSFTGEKEEDAHSTLKDGDDDDDEEEEESQDNKDEEDDIQSDEIFRVTSSLAVVGEYGRSLCFNEKPCFDSQGDDVKGSSSNSDLTPGVIPSLLDCDVIPFDEFPSGVPYMVYGNQFVPYLTQIKEKRLSNNAMSLIKDDVLKFERFFEDSNTSCFVGMCSIGEHKLALLDEGNKNLRLFRVSGRIEAKRQSYPIQESFPPNSIACCGTTVIYISGTTVFVTDSALNQIHQFTLGLTLPPGTTALLPLCKYTESTFLVGGLPDNTYRIYSLLGEVVEEGKISIQGPIVSVCHYKDDYVLFSSWSLPGAVYLLGKRGNIVRTFRPPGKDAWYPEGVCVDSQLNVYVANPRDGKVHVFGSFGVEVFVLACDLPSPTCLVMKSDNTLVVSGLGSALHTYRCTFYRKS